MSHFLDEIKHRKMSNKGIYLDNASTTEVADEVIEVVFDNMVKNYGNPSSLHKIGRDSKNIIEKSRKVIARKLNCNLDEIIFTSGGSEADNLAIKGYCMNVFNKESKNHIITTKIEHPAIIETFKFLESQGFILTFLDVDRCGFVSEEDLVNAVSDKTVLVSIMHVNNEIGVVQNIGKLAKLAKDKNKDVVFHSDAVQSFLKIPINLSKKMGKRGNEANVDMMSFSSHKIHGPKGIGAFYINSKLKNKLIKQVHGGFHEMGLRAGTENVAGISGFAKAVEIGNLNECSKIVMLRDYFAESILTFCEKNKIDTVINGYYVEKDFKKRVCNNLNISFRGYNSESLLLKLDMNNIYVSSGSACSSTKDVNEVSHVLKALNLSNDYANSSLRITFSKYNTKDDVEKSVEILKNILLDSN